MKIIIDSQPVEFPESCLASNKVTAHREKLVLLADAKYPPTRERGYDRFAQMADFLAAPPHNYSTTPDAIRSVLTRIKRRVLKWQDEQQLQASAAAQDHSKNSREWFMAYVGINVDDLVQNQKPKPMERRQIFIVADTHGYPHSFLLSAIKAAVKPDMEHHVVFAGDIYDVFCSSQIGMVNGVPLRAAQDGERRYNTETGATTGFMGALYRIMPEARHHLVRGNHDEVTKLFNTAPFWAIKALIKDPLQALAELFPNTAVVGWEVPYIETNGEVRKRYKFVPYAYIMGDVFISHLNKTGGQPFKSVTQTWDWIQAKRLVHDLNHIRVVLQAHSHKLSSQDIQGGHVRLLEIGFGGDPDVLQYQVGYNVWNSETSIGCVVLEQENRLGSWHTDMDTIRHLRP